MRIHTHTLLELERPSRNRDPFIGWQASFLMFPTSPGSPWSNGAFSPTEDGAVCFFTTCGDLSGAHPMEGPVLTNVCYAPINWLLPKGTWWIMMNHEDIWWYMMIYDDIWWYMLIYVDIWWCMMMYVDIWTSTAWGFLSHQHESLGINFFVS
jgi:hypothetical protein